MASIYGKGLKGKATKLHAKVVGQRGHCKNCGRTSNLQCAHIVSRRYTATRCDPENAFCLCAKCHMHFTEWPLEFTVFVLEQIGPEEYDELKQRAEAGAQGKDAFWQEWIDLLEPMLDT